MKQFIRNLTNSNGMAWAAVIIVVAQSFHYFHFFYSFDMYTEYINYVYALFFTVVFSLPLLIFTVKLGTTKVHIFGDSKDKKARENNEARRKYTQGVNLYMWIDIFINIYTWYTQLELFTNFTINNIPKYSVSTLIAIILPVTLKMFAGEIKTK